MVARWYLELPHKFMDIKSPVYVVMPNHFHAIIVNVGAALCVCPYKLRPMDNVYDSFLPQQPAP
jgi:hypothetical protein